MRSLIVMALALLVAACGSMPKHNETRVDAVSQISLTGFPKGSVVYLDGEAIATLGDGPNPIPIDSGVHELEVKNGSMVLYGKSLFIQRGTHRKIEYER